MELNNLKYKTMLLTGVPISETNTPDNISSLDSFLENEKKNNEAEYWSKMNKTIQTKKINIFIDEYSELNEFSEEEKLLLTNFLKDALDKKKLKKVKDVVYDKVSEKINSIPALHYNKQNKHFTLKNLDKRINTLKSLPKKFNSTIKNKSKIQPINEEA
jgi:hypothetical protein